MSYAASQKNFAIQFDYPGTDNLQVKSIAGKEKLSGLFKFQVDLISQTGNLDFKKVVGQKVTAKLSIDDDGKLGDGGYRYFNGIVTEFSYLGQEFEDVFRYRAVMRPWFWMLTRTTDCRIFQNMTVPDIVKEVFKLNNMVDFKLNLKAIYRDWEYCVQYNESDFNFISRLLEQEGIYYYFKHEDGKHVLTLVDDLSAHGDYPGFGSIVYNPGFAQGAVVENSVRYFAETRNIQPSTYTIQDYDFKNPGADLLAKYQNRPAGYEYPLEQPEIFDYPGEYVLRDQGNSYAEIRLQELQCQWERMNARGFCRGFAPGFTFTLKESPRDELNKKYLTVSIKHEMQNDDYRAGQGSFGKGKEEEINTYKCEIEVIDAVNTRFRPPRVTRKPIVRGPQTAMVVGKAGDEIYTDEFGRIKVQFHWDRYGGRDENSSCWMRVSQLWAGTKWGGIHIPRIGQEVIVNFLEGDPDRPLITGSVYNANCMPPYELVTNKTQSGIKSRSTLQGTADNFNEIRMEDKIGEEELYIQAEKNENILVKNDKTESVGNNETISIGNDREESVGHDEAITVGNDRKENVGNNEDLNVGNNRTRNVGVDESVTVGGKRDHSVGGNESVTVGGNQSVSIKGAHAVGVDGNRGVTVGGDHSFTVSGDEKRDISGKVVIKAGNSILLECGGASISLKANGDIKIAGKTIKIDGSSTIDVKSGGQVKIKGSTIAKN